MAAIAMTVNAFKTLALFNGKAEILNDTEMPSCSNAPDPVPGKT